MPADSINEVIDYNMKSRLLVQPNQTGNTFAYFKRRSNINSCIPVLFSSDGFAAVTDYEKACLLGGQCAAVYVRESQLPHINLQEKASEGSFQEVSITETQVLRLLRKLNPNKAAGVDAIHSKLLYELTDELCPPITACEVSTQLLSIHRLEGHVSLVF